MLEKGTKLGSYEILSPIGKGGMGEVYRARDTKLLREVAIKVLPAEVANDVERLQRFKREATTIAALNHPNIVTIFGIEESDGHHFLAMELIEGEALNRIITPGGLSLARIFDLAIPIADALATAHDRGIVHRDLKPGNVMVTRDGRVKILDFGLAKLTADGQSGSSSDDVTMSAPLTGQGMVIGTVPYMSPEQLQSKPVDHRSDIFSLGIMLYEITVGMRPFTGDNSASVMSSILRDTPRPVQELKSVLPRHLARIIEHCLEKDQEHRYQSAKDIRNELRALRKELDSGGQYAEPQLESMVISGASPRPPSSTSSTTMSGSGLSAPTRRGEFWIGVSVISIVIVFAVVWLGRGGNVATNPTSGFSRTETSASTTTAGAKISQQEPDIKTTLAILPFENISEASNTDYLSREIPASIIDKLSEISGLSVVSRSGSFRYDPGKEDATSFGKKLGVSVVLTGQLNAWENGVSIRAELVEVSTNKQLWSDHYQKTLKDIIAIESDITQQISQALRIELSAMERTHLAQVGTVDPAAYRSFLQGRFWWNKFTMDGYRNALDFFKQSIEQDPNYAPAYAELSNTYILMGGWYGDVPPRDAYPKAKQAALKAMEIDPTLAEAHRSLAFILFCYDWDFQGAEREFKRALELNPISATTYSQYGILLNILGRNSEAQEQRIRALELDPLLPIIHAAMGFGYAYAGQYEKAIKSCNEALKLNPNFPPAFQAKGYTYLCQGNYESAITSFQQAVSESRSVNMLGWLGVALAKAGRRAEAQMILIELGQESSEGHGRVSMAMIHGALDEVEPAFESLELAFKERETELVWANSMLSFNALRNDPRYNDMIRRMGLKPNFQSSKAARHQNKKAMLAVLPFKNLGAPDDEYFSDGISDEIRSRLSRVNKLDVISRSSAVQYRNSNKTNKVIGAELGVDYLIDGTIRWDKRSEGAGRVRITPELIRISDDLSVWSQPYDRQLEDIFEVQSEIATQIVDHLKVTLLEPEREAIDAIPTNNTEAYQNYLRGLNALKGLDFIEQNYVLAIQKFERAIELDPNFVLAYAGLSDAHAWMYHLGFDATSKRIEQSKAAVDTALKLQPDSPEAHLALAIYYYRCHRDYERALQALARSEKYLPNNPYVLEMKGYIHRRMGNFDITVQSLKNAFMYNPLSAELASSIAETYVYIRDYSNAEKWFDRSISLDRNQSNSYQFKALLYWVWQGDLEKSRVVLEEMPRVTTPFTIITWYSQELFEGHYQAALDRLIEIPGEFLEWQTAYTSKNSLAGFIYHFIGQPQRARDAFESARIQLEQVLQQQQNDPRLHSALGIVYAGLGRKDDAIREGKRGVELFPVSKDAMLGPVRVQDLAYIYTIVGEYDKAMDKIEYLFSIPTEQMSVHMLRIDPRWNPLRSHLRYIKLMKNYGYTPESNPEFFIETPK